MKSQRREFQFLKHAPIIAVKQLFPGEPVSSRAHLRTIKAGSSGDIESVEVSATKRHVRWMLGKFNNSQTLTIGADHLDAQARRDVDIALMKEAKT